MSRRILKKLKKLDKYQRCYICNKVSNEDIETNLGDCIKKPFIRDERYNAYMCLDCRENIEDNLESLRKRQSAEIISLWDFLAYVPEDEEIDPDVINIQDVLEQEEREVRSEEE